MDVQEHIAGFCRWLEHAEKMPKTIRNYQSKVQKFLEYLERHGIDPFNVSNEKVDLYLQFLLIKKKQKASSRNLALAGIKLFYDYFVSKGLIDKNPCAGVKGPKREKRRMGSLTNDEIQLMIHAPDLSTEIGMRDTALLCVLTAVGSRVSALTKLRTGDIRVETVTIPPRCYHCNQVDYSGASRMRAQKKQMAILTIREKGGKEWPIPLNDKAAYYLNQYLIHREHGKDSDILFPGYRSKVVKAISRHGILQVVKKHAEQAGIKGNVTPHSFRRAAITWLLDCGVDQMVVKNFFGHAALTTTEMYRNVTHRSFVFAGAAAERNLLEAIETPMDRVIDKVRGLYVERNV